MNGFIHFYPVGSFILAIWMSPFVIKGVSTGQIISKSCIFSPETEFTPLILASKSEFS